MCMHTSFGGGGLSVFGDMATFKVANGQISLSGHGLQSMVIEKLIDRNCSKNSCK